MMKFKDNYVETMRMLAKTVLDHDKNHGMLRGHNRSMLASLLEDHADDRVSWYLDFESVNGGAHVSLHVELETGWNSKKSIDDEGNEWREFDGKVELNWSSYGSSKLSLCRARLDLYEEIFKLATRLDASLPGKIMKLYRTKAEIEEQEQKQAKMKNLQTGEAIIKAEAKGLRIGAYVQGYFSCPNGGKLRVGSVELAINNKDYLIETKNDGHSVITRLS